MFRTTRLIALALAAATMTGSTHAQGLFIVDDDGGPGVFATEIQPAIDAAAPGSTILVREGDYSHFRIFNKGMKVVAVEGDEVRVHFVDEHGIHVENVPSFQSVVLRGLDVVPDDATGISGFDWGLYVKVAQGPVLVEDCSIGGKEGWNTSLGSITRGQDAAWVMNSWAVTFVRCEIIGGSGADTLDAVPGPTQEYPPGRGGWGLYVQDSTAYLYDSTFEGGHGGSVLAPGNTYAWDGADGQSGLIAQGTSFVYASGCTYVGGDGGQGMADVAPATCGDGGDADHGLHVVTATVEFLDLDSTAIAGVAGAPGCASGSAGVSAQGIEVLAGDYSALAGTAHGVEIDATVESGGAVTIELRGEPGEMAFLLVGFAPLAQWSQGLMGMLMPKSPLVIALGPMPVSGTMSLPLPIADVPVSTATMFLQGAFQAADGSAVLGAPSALTVFNTSL